MIGRTKGVRGDSNARVRKMCYGLNVLPSKKKKKIHAEALTPNVIVFGGGAFGR